jgi:hypothetical protein
VTEADARVLLRNSSSVGGLEGWMAEQRWQVEVGGWAIIRELQGWRLRVEVIAEGLRITARPPNGSPTVWIVAGRF